MDLSQLHHTISLSIGNREYTNYLSLDQELNFKKNKNYLFPLSYLGGLSFIGKEAESFLQGQVSCNVKEIQPSTMRSGALCNLKGRILALLDVILWNNCWQIIVPRDLLEATENTLNKTALLSRVKIEKVNYQIYGFYLDNAQDLSPLGLPLEELLTCHTRFAVWQDKNYYCHSLGDGFYIILVSNLNTKEAIQNFEEPFKRFNQLRGSFAWHFLLLCQKQFQIYPETRGLFLPHRLDLHLSGYLSFDKGCYKGQEIVARTHYKATLKHGLKLFYLDDIKESLSIGEKLLDESGATVGELIDYSFVKEGNWLILVSILFNHPTQVRLEKHNNLVILNEASQILIDTLE